MGKLNSDYRSHFPQLASADGEPSSLYLDHAATSLKPKSVVDAVSKYLSCETANVHRGVYRLSEQASERYEQTRAQVARFIGSKNEQEVIFTSGTTDSINRVASAWGDQNVRASDLIICTRLEHHSNFVPWQQLAIRKNARFEILECNERGEFDLFQWREILKRNPKIVALSGASNVLGVLPPVLEMGRDARAAGALVVLDAAQLAPHSRLDAGGDAFDAIAFSAHKVYGPTGLGVLWMRGELLSTMQPIEFGGGMISRVEDQTTTWAPVPQRFEAGTPPIAEVLGFSAALEFVESIGFEAIQSHEANLVHCGFEVLGKIPGIRIFGPGPGSPRAALFSFGVEGVHPHDLATFLSERRISVRAGHHCTQPLHRKLGVPATTRASFGIYSTTEDVEKLAQGIHECVSFFKRSLR